MLPIPRSIRARAALCACAIGTAIAVLLGGCGGGGGGSSSVNVLLADSPSCGYDHVFITVDHVEVSADGSGWTTLPVSSSLGRIDLLNLRNGALVSLGQQPLTAGTYQQVRLVLAPNGKSAPFANALVLAGATVETALKTPSAQQSGYKINGPLTVPSGASADLLLDFNACKSIVVAGASGQYLLKPVVTAIARLVSGSIAGTTIAGAHVYAEQQSMAGPVIVTGTVADTMTGAFTLSPIMQSSTAGTVDVVIVPPLPASGPGHATYVVQNVPVTAAATTSVGNITTLASSTINTISGTVTVAGSPGAANLVADQTVTSTARSYEIDAVATTTGPYSMTLAASGPWLGTYSTNLPIAFAQDLAAGDVGIYAVTATDAAGSASTMQANVSMGPATLGFMLTP
jgi:hypothetical protein